MPLSDWRQISVILDRVINREPESLLDIGCGYGAYGTLLRQYLPECWIVGVEPYEEYEMANGGLDSRWWAYDEIHHQAWPLSMNSRVFDVALLVDVLEHYQLREGIEAVNEALAISRCVIVATPRDPMRFPQDDLPNPYEKHQRRWSQGELVKHCVKPQGRSLAASEETTDSWVAVIE